ncbi:hypothetical protein [Guyparkeria sp. SCN-R1]|uniref:hypothetical protein n=1 Tax=Guyparkeria sp. SCN-R1 TaxID=2341113 RepID=UPI000F64EF90|nr:hypothetical protein [Guyparkeria sp. SCN-R1]
MFFKQRDIPNLTLDEIKHRARLLVIDDDDFPYKELFVSDGYNIDKWDDIEDLTKLESGYYDLILLDIHGVGSQQTDDQGFGILKHLRKTAPAQIIIAYSNADWSLKYQDFFDLADSRLDKRSDYVDFKRETDTLLKSRFSIGFYVQRISNLIPNPKADETKIRKCLQKSIKRNNTDKIHQYLNTLEIDTQKLNLALSTAQVAIGLSSL